MTEQQIEAIQFSWSYIIMNADDSGYVFYERLFEIAPELQKLFSTNTDIQAQKFIEMLTYIMSKIDNLDAVTDNIKELGKRHKSYDVKEEHYPIVKKALLWTLARGLADKWTEEMEQAWIVAYDYLTHIMTQEA